MCLFMNLSHLASELIAFKIAPQQLIIVFKKFNQTYIQLTAILSIFFETNSNFTFIEQFSYGRFTAGLFPLILFSMCMGSVSIQKSYAAILISVVATSNGTKHVVYLYFIIFFFSNTESKNQNFAKGVLFLSFQLDVCPPDVKTLGSLVKVSPESDVVQTTLAYWEQF